MHVGEAEVTGTDAWTQVVADDARAEVGYRARNAWKRLEGGEGQEKGEQSGSTSEARSDTGSITGSSVGKESHCGVRSPARTSRRARRALCVA